MNEKANPNFRSPTVAGYALVVNGHSLIHALSPSMEQLFLSVAEHCSGEAQVCSLTQFSGLLTTDGVS